MSNEQKLIDIMFDVVMTMNKNPWFIDKSNEELAEWVTKQLKESGFDTEPCGSSWGVLKNYPMY